MTTRRAVLLVMLFTITMGCLAQDDAEGCKDSPLITRMPGSKLDSCDHKEFDELEIPVGKTAAGEPEQKKLDGELWTWSYSTREGTSAVQVYRNMAAALRKAGFYVVYEQPNDYLTAHKGNTWIYLNTGAATYYEQKVLQEKQMQQEVTADASSLADEINKTGHVAVYGIHFETAKATIEPDSEETLNQIVKLLQENPDLKLSVQGHTDNVGSKAANQALSEKRAQSVVAWLTGHGVTANRLSAKGLGDTQPVSDNSTEDGRARNRRVELVKQ